MTTVRAKPFIQNLSHDICSPFFDKNGNLYCISQDTGDILLLNESGNSETIHCTNGQPSGAVFDDENNLYVADFAHASVLLVATDGTQELVVGVYEDKPLKGPHSIVRDAKGNIYFSDSGPLGETGLHAATGSIFSIANTSGGQILKPLSLENLASPSGIALSPNGKLLYVCEQMTNRILRYFQRPEGVYHGSVFCQLSGGIGPSAVVVDKQGTLYVAQADVSENSNDGQVFVISKTGKITSTILTTGSDVSGLAIR